MHSTMVSGESAKPTKKHIMELADYFKIKNAPAIIDQVQEVLFNWKYYADYTGVRSDSKNKIQRVIGNKI